MMEWGGEYDPTVSVVVLGRRTRAPMGDHRDHGSYRPCHWAEGNAVSPEMHSLRQYQEAGLHLMPLPVYRPQLKVTVLILMTNLLNITSLLSKE